MAKKDDSDEFFDLEPTFAHIKLDASPFLSSKIIKDKIEKINPIFHQINSCLETGHKKETSKRKIQKAKSIFQRDKKVDASQPIFKMFSQPKAETSLECPVILKALSDTTKLRKYIVKEVVPKRAKTLSCISDTELSSPAEQFETRQPSLKFSNNETESCDSKVSNDFCRRKLKASTDLIKRTYGHVPFMSKKDSQNQIQMHLKSLSDANLFIRKKERMKKKIMPLIGKTDKFISASTDIERFIVNTQNENLSTVRSLVKKNEELMEKYTFVKKKAPNIEDTKPVMTKEYHLIIRNATNGANQVGGNPNIDQLKNEELLEKYYQDYRIGRMDALNRVNDQLVYKYRELLLKKLGYSDLEKEKEYFKMNLSTSPCVKNVPLTENNIKKKNHRKVQELIEISNKKSVDLLNRIEHIFTRVLTKG